jgi:hypothetical protein
MGPVTGLDDVEIRKKSCLLGLKLRSLGRPACSREKNLNTHKNSYVDDIFTCAVSVDKVWYPFKFNERS